MYRKVPSSVPVYYSMLELFGQTETANWAESGKHQFGSEPSEILNLRSSTTPETVAVTPP